MPERPWNEKQRQGFETRGGSLLVSAAAGSGKTAVLVERVLRRITDPHEAVDQVALWEPTPCIRCGRCVRACPTFLVPPVLVQASDSNELDAFERLNGMECIECGCCTYVCPAKRRLTQSFKTAKASINAARRAKAAEAKK